MNQDSAVSAYKATHYESAPPLKLVQLMYEGALRFLAQAEAADAGAEAARFQERSLRALAVISELRLALDQAQAPQLAERLHTLYLFAEGEIRAAMLAGSSVRLGPVREILGTLLEGWSQLELTT